MTKIAHITTIDASVRSLLLNQLCAFREAGYEIVAISSPGRDVPAIEAAGIRHISVPMTRNMTPLADLLSLWRLYRTMRRERFAVVHTHNPKPGLLGQLAARLAGVPVVVNTVHGFYFHEHMPLVTRRFLIMMEKVAAWCSDLILSQNHEDIDTGVAENIFSREQVRHLGNGIDLTLFDPSKVNSAELSRLRNELGIPEGTKVVGFVGRLAARRKGFLDYLRAAKELSKQYPGNLRLLIVGESDSGKQDAVEPSVAGQFGLSEMCHFLGRRDNSELPAIYQLMDVLVLPSLFEGIPRVIMEAAAMGVPAVASDVKGNREAVVNGQTGLLVPFGDVTALSRAIQSILDNSATAKHMALAAQSRAVMHFDERNVFRKVITEYARLETLRR